MLLLECGGREKLCWDVYNYWAGKRKKWGKPILLPAKVNLYVRRIDGVGGKSSGNFDIAILNRRKGYPYLTATTRGA